MRLRVAIADDEPLARKRLRQLLQSEPHVEVIAECGNGRETLTAIRDKSPHLVFLDVNMPELDGFGVVEELNGTPLPAIIFVTAHGQFATRAFDVYAVDYLVKPFDKSRFQAAIGRARQRLEKSAATQNASALAQLIAVVQGHLKPLENLLVKSGERITFLPVGEIEWISSADNYVELHTRGATHLMRATISTLCEQLPQNSFARISRSSIVNLDQIKELRPGSHGDFLVLLRNGRQLPGSRNFRENLTQVLGSGR